MESNLSHGTLSRTKQEDVILVWTVVSRIPHYVLFCCAGPNKQIKAISNVEPIKMEIPKCTHSSRRRPPPPPQPPPRENSLSFYISFFSKSFLFKNILLLCCYICLFLSFYKTNSGEQRHTRTVNTMACVNWKRSPHQQLSYNFLVISLLVTLSNLPLRRPHLLPTLVRLQPLSTPYSGLSYKTTLFGTNKFNYFRRYLFISSVIIYDIIYYL